MNQYSNTVFYEVQYNFPEVIEKNGLSFFLAKDSYYYASRKMAGETQWYIVRSVNDIEDESKYETTETNKVPVYFKTTNKIINYARFNL